jgi:hypothetical protein
MADALQPDVPLRSPAAQAALTNKDGIVAPPEGLADATSALDDLFKDQMGRDPTQLDNTADRDRDRATDREITTAQEMPDPEAEDEVVSQPEAEVTPPQTTPVESETEAEEPKTDDLLDKLLGKTDKLDPKPDASAAEEDPYEKVKLRADASERTKDTFESLKKTAKEREAKVRAEADAARKELIELRTKVEDLSKRTVPDNIEAELKELREFRATFDAERDPAFQQKFSSRVEQNNSTIFETLKRNGLKDALVDQVKELPYDQQVEQIARWAEKLSPRDKLLVNARLADNEAVEFDRQAALREVKAKAEQILADRKKAPDNFVEEAVKTLKPFLPQIPFLHLKEVPANATAAVKAEVEKHNAIATEAQGSLLNLLNDQSPKTRSILALAGVLAPRYQAQLKEAETRIKTLESELGNIREAGRLSRTARSSGTAERAAPKVNIFETTADEALDAAWERMQG